MIGFEAGLIHEIKGSFPSTIKAGRDPKNIAVEKDNSPSV